MADEYGVQIDNKTWSLVHRPKDANIVNFMCLFKHKHDANNFLIHDKARLVANEKTQAKRIYYDETFSPVVKPATIRTVLHVSISEN